MLASLMAARFLHIPAPRRWLSLALLCLLAPLAAPAADDPGALMLNAWMLREEGMRAEKERDFPTAYNRYRESAKVYERLAREFPDAHPGIVEMRRTGLAEQISRIADAAASMEAGRPVPRPPPATVVRPVPRGPGVAIRPPAATATSVDDPAARRRLAALEQRQAAVEKLLAERTRERDSLRSSLEQTRQSLLLSEHQLARARAAQADAASRLAELQAKGINTAVAEKAEIESLKTRLAEATRTAEAAAAESQRLRAELAVRPAAPDQQLETDLQEARRELAAIRDERAGLAAELDQTRAERDRFAALLAASAPVSAAELLAANQRLEAELAKAREELAALGAQRDRDSEVIAGLRQRLGEVEAELAAVRLENDSYRAQVARLEDQLAQASDSLAEARTALRDASLSEENRALRQIVTRLLQQQAYRSRARRLLLNELAKLEINSKVLLQYIDQLEGKAALPGPEQIARIKDPYIEALAGVGLSAMVFIDEAAADPSATPAPAAPAFPPELAGDPEALEAFEFQKTSLARSAAEAFTAGEFAKAADTYSLILDADPGDVRVRCNLGVAQLRQRRFEEAAATFNSALAADEANAFAHLMLGVCHWQLQQSDMAVDHMNRSLVLQPRNPQAWLYLGLVALDRNAPGDAETAFRKTLELDPDNADAHYNLAVLHTKPGRADPVEAARRYRDAIRLGAARDPALESFLRLGESLPPAAPPAGPYDAIPEPPPGPEWPEDDPLFLPADFDS
jgi:Tfp pilus assembly protein PilF